jgi:hypothetical protein
MHRKLYTNPMVGRTGLGNMLFPWARAEVFCGEQRALMLAPQWVNICRIGPWLRRERDKRYYFSAFSNAGYIRGLRREYILRAASHADEAAYNAPSMSQGTKMQVIDFAGMAGFFSPLLAHRTYIRERIHAITSEAILKQLDQLPHEPFIGVHIRRGDFQRGGMAIGDEWYACAIDRAIRTVGEGARNSPIRIFSDAEPEAMESLCKRFSSATLMPKAPALLDLLLLSRCEALVGTSRSTFSMWAAFLGQMPSFWHPCETPPPFSITPRATVEIVDPAAEAT